MRPTLGYLRRGFSSLFDSAARELQMVKRHRRVRRRSRSAGRSISIAPDVAVRVAADTQDASVGKTPVVTVSDGRRRFTSSINVAKSSEVSFIAFAVRRNSGTFGMR